MTALPFTLVDLLVSASMGLCVGLVVRLVKGRG